MHIAADCLRCTLALVALATVGANSESLEESLGDDAASLVQVNLAATAAAAPALQVQLGAGSNSSVPATAATAPAVQLQQGAGSNASVPGADAIVCADGKSWFEKSRIGIGNREGRHFVSKRDCNIFTLWRWDFGVPNWIDKNMETLRQHSHGVCGEPILINESNVGVYIPDMPAEFWAMPYMAVKSDLIRYAFIYHHGGVYIDSDFLVTKDLRELLKKSKDHDLVSYTTGDQSCEKPGKGLGQFSSNFIGGRKGSAFHKAVWEEQKRQITNHCPLEEEKLHKACCFNRTQKDGHGFSKQCNVPWALLGEDISHRLLTSHLATDTPPKVFCVGSNESFAPPDFPEVLKNHPETKETVKFYKDRNVPSPLNRTMYHLFTGMFFYQWRNLPEARFVDSKYLLGELYNQSRNNYLADEARSKSPNTSAV